jgi:hypothetical protein
LISATTRRAARLDALRESFQHANAFVPADARISDALSIGARATFLEILAARHEIRRDHYAADTLVGRRDLAADIGCAYRTKSRKTRRSIENPDHEPGFPNHICCGA